MYHRLPLLRVGELYDIYPFYVLAWVLSEMLAVPPLEKINCDSVVESLPSWASNADLMTWLKGFSKSL